MKWSTYGRLKIKDNFKFLALKVVTVANERLSLRRGSKYSDFDLEIFGILENWLSRRGCRLHEVVATRGSTVLSYACLVQNEINTYSTILVKNMF